MSFSVISRFKRCKKCDLHCLEQVEEPNVNGIEILRTKKKLLNSNILTVESSLFHSLICASSNFLEEIGKTVGNSTAQEISTICTSAGNKRESF